MRISTPPQELCGVLRFCDNRNFRYSRLMSHGSPIVLTIAGFDPSSGAVITADIKTIAAHGCYGVSAITALTVQSTAGVREVVPVDLKLLAHTLEELQGDVKVSAVHIGMLGNSEVVSRVADFLRDARLRNLVLDPVLESSSGAALLDKADTKLMIQRLLPLADVITPNVEEAAALTGLKVKDPAQMKLAA